jgi:peptidyl-prolyl cis-trans isomerase B (cyclophilin B)
MGIDMKKLSAAVSVAIISLLPVAPIHAAEKPTKVAGCKTPIAKAHAPATVKEPMAVAKSLPKTMTIDTNCGAIVISLLTTKAPLTITKITALAKAKYFDLSFCHRLTTEGLFVLQCGDPTASGSGNPTGWKGYKDENLPANKANNYPIGTVAMANSGPGTNGSQFFIIYADTTLGPNYTIWGKVTKGLDLVKKIAEVGAYKINSTDNKPYYASDGYPIQTIEIRKVSVK